MSYHMNQTGSARSVGAKRIRKQWVFPDGTTVVANSAAEARRLTGKLYQRPIVQPGKGPFGPDNDVKPGTGGGTGGGGAGSGNTPTWTTPTIAVTGLPVTGDATGTQTANIDFDFKQQDIPAGGKTFTITYDTGSGDQTTTMNASAGSTPVQVTNALVTAVTNNIPDLDAARGTGTTITLTPADTVVLSKFSISVS
jgi:hypothetical protein